MAAVDARAAKGSDGCILQRVGAAAGAARRTKRRARARAQARPTTAVAVGVAVAVAVAVGVAVGPHPAVLSVRKESAPGGGCPGVVVVVLAAGVSETGEIQFCSSPARRT